MIGSGLMRTRMRVRSRTIATSATGQALAPIESTLVDLVGHVVTSKRQDSLINRGEAAVDEIEIVIPWYPNILTGFVVQVFDIVGGSTVQTNYEVMEVIDDRNKHRQLRLRCKVGERSVTAGTYAVELILVAGGGGGGGTNNIATNNLLLQSTSFSASPWGVAASIAVANSGTAPDNVGSGRLLTVTSGSFASVNQSIANGSNRTFSIYLKAGSSSSISVGVLSFSTTWGVAANSSGTILSGPGTITRNNGALFDVTGLSASDWTRIAINRTDSHDALYLYPVGVGSGLTGSNVVWGAQAESGATATNFVPTTTASVTGYAPGGGGGGGGGVTTGTLQFATGQTYAVVIGSGGAGASGSSRGSDGTSTTFPGVTTAVGGGGGGSGASSANKDGRNGGSGGGAGGFDANGAGGSPTAGQGNAGGNGLGPSIAPYRGAGGGGAANSGGNGNGASGIGGDGLGPFGGIVQFGAGGGGGTMASSVVAVGGVGGGGNGGTSASGNGSNASANTGSGGGGAGGTGTGGAASTGGTGSNGIVFLRYLGSSAVITYTGSQTVNISGGYVTHSLLTSGTVTA